MVQIVEYLPGDTISLKISAAVTKGQALEVTGVRTVGPAANDSKKFIGVALEDQATVGLKVRVLLARPIVRLQDSGSGITAGDLVANAASGKIKTYAPVTKTGYIASTSGGSPTVQVTMIGADGATFAGDKWILGVAFDTFAANAWAAVILST